MARITKRGKTGNIAEGRCSRRSAAWENPGRNDIIEMIGEPRLFIRVNIIKRC
jgi:hypothetical protein